MTRSPRDRQGRLRLRQAAAFGLPTPPAGPGIVLAVAGLLVYAYHYTVAWAVVFDAQDDCRRALGGGSGVTAAPADRELRLVPLRVTCRWAGGDRAELVPAFVTPLAAALVLTGVVIVVLAIRGRASADRVRSDR